MTAANRSRSLSLSLLAAGLVAFAGQARADQLDEVIKSFEGKPRYVEPLATIFGSMTNSGWYQSAGVKGVFGFYFGLPVSVVNIADADRSYDATFTDDGCVAFHADGGTGGNCQETTKYKAPTIFGRDGAPTLERSNYNPNLKAIVDTMEIPVSDGLPEVADFNWFPFLMPQVGFSAFNTELKVRYFLLPLGKFNLNAYGVGIQHDLGSFLPVLPVNLSVVANYTAMGVEFEPGEGIKGTLELDGSSYFVGALVGYNLLGMFEVFAEAGWEGASIQTGGNLTLTADSQNAVVKPDLDVDGRNGFRAALNLAFHFGYQAVVGQNVGANIGNQVNILGFRIGL